MRLPVEILNRIFSFLVSDLSTLTTCSKDPLLFPIVERHLYYHVHVHFDGRTDNLGTFGPDDLSNRISENPRIVHYVRILHLEFNSISTQTKVLLEFATTLRMFSLLESIWLTGTDVFFQFPDAFRAAFEDRLGQPTIKELRLDGRTTIPVSWLNRVKNLEDLFLSGSFDVTGRSSSTLPQLKSLSMNLTSNSFPAGFAWIDLHTNTVQSLRLSNLGPLFQLRCLQAQTLNILDICLHKSQYYTHYYFSSRRIRKTNLPELLFYPPNLQRLTLRAAVILIFRDMDVNNPQYSQSWLPVAAVFINLSPPSLQHLVLDIHIDLPPCSDFSRIDFSPLRVLGTTRRSVQRIDLYVHTNSPFSALTRARLFAGLEEYEDVMELIKKGVLVIHAEKSAPDTM